MGTLTERRFSRPDGRKQTFSVCSRWLYEQRRENLCWLRDILIEENAFQTLSYFVSNFVVFLWDFNVIDQQKMVRTGKGQPIHSNDCFLSFKDCDIFISVHLPAQFVMFPVLAGRYVGNHPLSITLPPLCFYIGLVYSLWYVVAVFWGVT